MELIRSCDLSPLVVVSKGDYLYTWHNKTKEYIYDAFVIHMSIARCDTNLHKIRSYIHSYISVLPMMTN